MKIISLNAEEDKRLEGVLRFLENEKPDVVCMQEFFADQKDLFAQRLGMHGVYDHELMCVGNDGQMHSRGNVIFSKQPFSDTYVVPYTKLENFEDTSNSFAGYKPELDQDINTINRRSKRKILAVDIWAPEESKKYRIATTKFTWGYYGRMDREKNKFVWGISQETLEKQKEDMLLLIDTLENLGEVVFCVDLNAPRGKEVFDTLASKLKDNIPPTYTSSIDGALHRAGALPLMVDGLFTSKEYIAKNVRLVGGVSDHMAVVAEIGKMK